MIYENTPQLRSYLEPHFPRKAAMGSFDLDAAEYQRHFEKVASRPPSERADAAAFRCLTFDQPPEKVAEGQVAIEQRFDRLDTDLITRFNGIHGHVDTVAAKDRKRAWIRFAITTALLIVLILLFATRSHAQNTNSAVVVATCGTPPTVYPAASAGSPNRAPMTVDTNGNLCAGVSVSATIATAGLAISVATGASTAGVVVTPVAGMVSTGAPTYTTGTVRELSLDTAGALRVNAAVSVPGALSVSTTTGGNGGQVAVVGAVSDGTAASFAPIQIAGVDDAGKIQTIRTTAAGNTVVSLETTSGSIGTVTVTDGAGALNVIVDSGTLTSITNTVTVQGTTGGVAVTMAASSGGTITAVPMNQNGVKTGGQICDSTGANCATITGNKLDVNATVSAAANQIVSTLTGGNGGQVATVGARSSGTAVTFGPVFTGGKDDAGNLEAIRTTVAGNTVVSLETTSGVIGHIVADSGSTTAVTGTVTVQGTTGGVAVTMAGTSGGTITTIPLNQNGVRVGSQVCNSAGDACATITGNKLDVNATVSANANQTVSTLTGGNGGQVAVVGAISDGTTASFAPIQIAGIDDAGKIQTLRTTAAGNAVVSLETTSGVIGHIVADSGSTTAVTQATGTNLHAVIDSGTITVTDGAGALNVIVDSGTLTSITNTVTVAGVTGGVAVTIAGTSGGTITTIPINQNGVIASGRICNATGDSCASITGGKLDVNASVSASANQVVSTSAGGNGGQVAVVGVASDGTTAAFSPIYVAGVDDTGALQAFRTTPAGNTVVSLETTSGVIGHVICDSGCSAATGANINQINGQTTATSGNGVLAVGAATSAGFTVVDPQILELLADLHGNSGIHKTGDRAGLNLRSGPFNKPVDATNPLPVVVQGSGDPCLNQLPLSASISQTTSTKVISAGPGRIVICGMRIVVAAAEVTSEVEGTGTLCATGIIAHSGSTTAANGESFAANGGYDSSKHYALVPGNDFCIAQSGSNRVSGQVSYLRQLQW